MIFEDNVSAEGLELIVLRGGTKWNGADTELESS